MLRKTIRRASSVIAPRKSRRRMSFGLMVDIGMVECGMTIVGKDRKRSKVICEVIAVRGVLCFCCC